MLTDSLILKGRKANKKRLPSEVKKHYSDSQKLEAAKLWLVVGNLTQVAAALEIPRDTLVVWRHSNWWKELITELKTETSIQLSAKLRKIANLALGETEDRIINGDQFYNYKTGKIERKPVSLNTVHRVAVDLIGKSIELEKQPDTDLNQKQVLDKLEVLKRTFEQFAKHGKITSDDVIDIDFKETDNALHEKREEGLQAGTSLGTQEEAESGQRPGGEEQSQSNGGKEAWKELAIE